MCILIALYSLRGVSSQAHELVLPFLMGTSSSLVVRSVTARCSRNRSRLSAPRTPASCRRARTKARLRSASAKHSGVGCRCAPRPGAVPLGSAATNQAPAWSFASVPATTRSNSRLAARSRHPMQVRTGPSLRVEMSSCETTADHHTGAEALFRNGKACRERDDWRSDPAHGSDSGPRGARTPGGFGTAPWRGLTLSVGRPSVDP